MRTPFGSECKFYYEDYHRGRNRQECRLAQQSGSKDNWSFRMCKSCALPRLQQANSCINLFLFGQAQKGLLGLGRRMNIYAHCSKDGAEVEEPEIGCGRCHTDNPVLAQIMELD